MVVTMKRLELLLYHKEREHFLESLRSLGVIHVIESDVAANSDDVQKGQLTLQRCEKVLQNLKKIKNEKAPSTQKNGDIRPEEILDRYESLEEKHEKLSQELQALLKDREQLEPWGAFDVSLLNKLQNAGVTIRFFTLPVKKFGNITTTDNSIIVQIKELDGLVYFVAIEHGDELSIEAEEVRVPELSLTSLNTKIDECQSQVKECELSIETLTSALPVLEEYRVENENQLNYKRTYLSMADHAEGKVLHLSGWFPADRKIAICNLLKNYSAWYSMRDPLPDDNVPVKLRNAKLPKLFEPITGLYSLPHYSELDITPFMAPFFALFFGLCLGDAGYGLLLLIGAITLIAKGGQKIKPFAWLGLVLGVATMISGILLNGFFGQAIFGGPGVKGAFLSSGVKIFAPLSTLVTDNGQIFPAMGLALVLGFVQILFGMSLQAYIRIKNYGFTAGIQSFSSMMVFFGSVVWAAHTNFMNLDIDKFTVGPVLIGSMLISIPVIVAKILTWGGLILFFFFNNVDKKIFIRPAIGIWEFYNFASGILGDLLSYLRLFALGLAGGLLGAAFNQIAFMFITSKDGNVNYASAGIIGTILVLLFGHTLNFALSAIGSFVHPLRLTFVEFYKNIGFKGGSKPYIPFAKVK